MIMPSLKRGTSQVMFRYLPGALFADSKIWYIVTDMKMKELNENTEHLLQNVYSFVDNWIINNDLKNDLYPKRDDMYCFGEVEEIKFELFPLVFKCDNEACGNVHEYKSLEELKRRNPQLKCKFCGQGKLKQYPYALVHLNGDIQALNVKTNKGKKTWEEKYRGIRMRDTRRFDTATWYNYIQKKSLGSLGTKRTTLPLTKTMRDNNKYYLGGSYIADGSNYYPALLSFVNLEHEKLSQRKELDIFPYVQIGALLGLPSINKERYNENFLEKDSSSTIRKLLEAAKNNAEKELLMKLAKETNIQPNDSKKNLMDEIQSLFDQAVPIELIKKDNLLHEFLYTCYENNGSTLDEKLNEAQESYNSIQETAYINAKDEATNLGLDTITLFEKFPVITMGIGYTRRSFDRSKAVLNPFVQKIKNNRHKIHIPVFKNENEAIVFKLDPLRVLAWLKVNELITIDMNKKMTKAKAHAILYKYLVFSYNSNEDLSKCKLEDYMNDNRMKASILTFRLLHSFMHVLFHSGKSIIGLDVDSMSEYLFPSCMAGAIYVSKLQGGGMGALIAAFENDLARWLRNTYEKTQTCLYDPICKEKSGACHACLFLKFSCQHFNHGLSRNLLNGGEVENYAIKGYYSIEVDKMLKSWDV
ncbi:DUF1998 domain-containing protein [Crassaminicella indica]|uniref:DUF1998 domain-containing protein n=1 Tax=Crassaminicella indica TaxID=2855394 RepID=A0ABX8RCY4_9CLOT|nr:DUF1998 domain-containing protein [Crassaminicella indica]QXM06626.1 DUF1998 domain-containing protein [Crassaminicella indica]